MELHRLFSQSIFTAASRTPRLISIVSKPIVLFLCFGEGTKFFKGFMKTPREVKLHRRSIFLLTGLSWFCIKVWLGKLGLVGWVW